MDILLQDLRYAVRTLLRAPGFTAVAVLTLALGIGATSAIFSAVYAVVLRPFPFADPQRVVLMEETWRGEPGDVSPANFVELLGEKGVFEGLAASRSGSFNLDAGGEPERVEGERVTSGYFAAFGAAPALGRTFAPAEDPPGGERVAIVSHRLWMRRLGGDAAVVGRPVRVGGEPYTVVGVMPQEFDATAGPSDLWLPLALTPEQASKRDEHYLMVFGRLLPGVTLEAARARMAAAGAGLVRRFPKDNAERSLRLTPYVDAVVGDYRQRLMVMLGAVGFVLLIACANVASLVLARAAGRSREIAIRGALGAGRWRVVRQMLTESAVLGGAGAAAGLALAWWGVGALVAAGPPGIPRLEQAAIDGPVLAFTAAVALASTVLLGLAPALRAARPDLQGTLNQGGRGSTAGPASDRLRAALVVGEVALALTLLVGAGLLVRSAVLLAGVQPGFDPDGLVAGRLSLPAARYARPEDVSGAMERIAAELAATPGVEASAVATTAAFDGAGSTNGLVPEGRPLEAASAIDSRMRIVTPGYFGALRIPLRRGRDFTAADGPGAPRVIVVSEAFARVAWPGQNPMGKRIACCEAGPDGAPLWKEVVGVAGDVHSDGPAQPSGPEFYLPVRQAPAAAWSWTQRSMTLVARGRGGSGAVTAAMRAAAHAVDPSLPLYEVATLRDRIGQSTLRERFNGGLLSVLGAIGLLLAVVGIYGVTAYFVTQRTHEIGVRVALGAASRDVLRLVVGRGLGLALLGVALGSAASLALTRFLSGFLFGVSPTDPLTFVVVAALLAGVALLASWLPARRAVRVDPMVALRQD
ncbi:MAG TPA: ABC transporter permease [Longimicrobiaceae bacterium]|jgi:putative ABC transport system permease protein|nr:ABC transporter permease [Longimicrobiaceae bacterium]